MNKEELLEKFDVIISKDRLNHAYLIETDEFYDSSFIKDVIKKIIRKDLTNDKEYEDICLSIDTLNYDNLKIIKPTGNAIKKEQILTLMSDYKTKSLKNNYRFYIIEYAEDLNISAANTILKFLEEPEPYIVAFLITKNVNNLLETIISRCQLINLNHNIRKEFDLEKYNKYLKYLEIFEEKNEKSIAFLNELYLLSADELKLVFQVWIEIYMDKLSKYSNELNKPNINKKEDKTSDIIKKIKNINESIELLKNNINTRLLLDRIFMGGD